MANTKFSLDYNKALPKEFYSRETEQVAKNLLGKAFVCERKGKPLAAMITETEAYLYEGDPSCHASRGKTKRNAAMFESGGTLYVYTIYGIHSCANIATEKSGKGCAALIRAAEPLLGIDEMKKNRGTSEIKALCKGPGNFAKAFGLTKEDSFKSLLSKEIFVQEYKNIASSEIKITGRIGISKAADLPLRFFIKNSAFVSGKKS